MTMISDVSRDDVIGRTCWRCCWFAETLSTT